MVIKGYSKSAGYQPGVKFEDNRFRNSWNAVYVAGAWRFVQCNWGARHLVNAKEVPKPGRAKSDSLRYNYYQLLLQILHLRFVIRRQTLSLKRVRRFFDLWKLNHVKCNSHSKSITYERGKEILGFYRRLIWLKSKWSFHAFPFLNWWNGDAEMLGGGHGRPRPFPPQLLSTKITLGPRPRPPMITHVISHVIEIPLGHFCWAFSRPHLWIYISA